MNQDTIDFIKSETAKEKSNSPLAIKIAALVIFLAPLSIGLLFRPSMSGVFDWRILIPNLSAAILITLFPVLFQKRFQMKNQAFWLMSGALLFALLFSIDRIFSTPITADGAPTRACFQMGVFSAILMGIWLTFYCFSIASLPSRRWRFLNSAVAGVSASVMLGFHCDQSAADHILIGHVAPSILIGALVFGFQEFYFRIRLQRLLPKLAASSKNSELKNTHRL